MIAEWTDVIKAESTTNPPRTFTCACGPLPRIFTTTVYLIEDWVGDTRILWAACPFADTELHEKGSSAYTGQPQPHALLDGGAS